MKRFLTSTAALLTCGTCFAQNLLLNGNLDRTHAVEIVPGFFSPKPDNWINDGFRTIAGPYEDEMSSEPWAGPAPTPVTTDGQFNAPHPEGHGGLDGGVFFKPFSGSAFNGAATGHLYQDVIASPGLTYTLTGWAGAEQNALMDAELALEFFDSGNALMQSHVLDLVGAGLFTDNGQPFGYKQFSVSGTAPDGVAYVRSRISMLNAMANPAGGGQAYVVDDFELTAVPEPGTVALGVAGLLGALAIRRKKGAR